MKKKNLSLESKFGKLKVCETFLAVQKPENLNKTKVNY